MTRNRAIDETLNRIHQAATNERHLLYRAAARQPLTSDQLNRLQQLDSDLPMLWDRYRREFASRSYAPVIRFIDQQRRSA